MPSQSPHRDAQERVNSSQKFKHYIMLLHTVNGLHRMKMTIACVMLLYERLRHYSSKLFERCLVFDRSHLVGVEIQRSLRNPKKFVFDDDSVKTDDKLVDAAALFEADRGRKRGRSHEGRAAVS